MSVANVNKKTKVTYLVICNDEVKKGLVEFLLAKFNQLGALGSRTLGCGLRSGL
jgi:hypothetical protein